MMIEHHFKQNSYYFICQDAILRRSAMYTLAMAYAGTGNNKAIRTILHVAVWISYNFNFCVFLYIFFWFIIILNRGSCVSGIYFDQSIKLEFQKKEFSTEILFLIIFL